MPAYNDIERGLMDLLEQVRQQNRTATVQPVLPPLDESLLMSPGGHQELQAAQTLAGLTPQEQARHMEMQMMQMIQPRRVAASSGEPDLRSLLMAEAHRAIGYADDPFGAMQEAEPIPAYLETFDPVDEMIEFGTDDELPGTTAPNPRARFQVGRETPPRNDFSNNRIPTGGQVVSQRGPNGFQPVQAARPPAEALRATERKTASSAPRAPVAPSAPRPSRFQLLLKDDLD